MLNVFLEDEQEEAVDFIKKWLCTSDVFLQRQQMKPYKSTEAKVVRPKAAGIDTCDP